MALVINTNLSSIKAQMNLEKTQLSLSSSLQRISSGLRINSPKDDAAGLAISQRLTSQIGKLGMAVKNANDGISFIQSAEVALGDISTMLQRIQELATQSLNASSGATDRGLLQAQVVKLNESIGQVAEVAKFNGQKVLTGKVVNAEFQVGILAEETIRVTIPKITSANIGNYSIKTDNTGASAIGAASLGSEQGVAPSNLVQAQVLTIRGFSSAQTGTEVAVEERETAKSIAEKINAVEALTGVTAVASSYATLEDIYDIATSGTQKISFRLYGTNTKGIDSEDFSNAVSISAAIKSGSVEDLQSLVTAINEKISITGISAKTITAKDDDGNNVVNIALSNGGVDIGIENFRNDPPTADDPVPATEITVRGFKGTQKVTLVEGVTDSVSIGGTVTLNSAKSFTVTSDAISDTSLFISGVEGVSQTADFDPLSSADLSTDESARRALVSSTSALDFISSLRGDLGAIQSRFESTISNLGATQENTETARSRILDADFAQETAKLTRAQVLQQAGIAILAQANSTPQAVLALLRT